MQKNIKKILAIIKIEVQKQMMYRADFLFFRLTNMVEVATMIIVWTIVFKNSDFVFGYNYNQMMTYVTVGWLMRYLTGSYGLENIVSRNIYDGSLSGMMTKPIDYIKYIIVFSLGRVSVAYLSGILTAALGITIMINHILPVSSILNLLIIIVMLFFGYFVNLFVSILIGMLAFWTTFISGPRYSINALIWFLKGSELPLNMLPIFLYKATLLSPFAYIFFMPLQLYLGKISTSQGLLALGVELIWLVLLYGLIRISWKRGLKRFEGVGI